MLGTSVQRYRVVLSSILLLAACSQDISGPKPMLPVVSKSASPPPVDPGIVCNAQHSTDVTLHGEGLSPVPVGIPGHPRAALPTVSLLRGHGLDGAAVAKPDTITFSGEPVADPTNVTDPAAANRC